MKVKTFIPKLEQIDAIVKSKIYYRRGVQVDLVKTKFNTDTELKEILVAVKRNVEGFWDEGIQDFIPEPTHLNTPGQERHVRHSQEVFANEKQIMFDIVEETFYINIYYPTVFHTMDTTLFYGFMC